MHAPTGTGKTVATLAPLIEHAAAADHRVLYLVRTHAQEVQVLRETATIGHRLEQPILTVGLEGRARRCFLLENDREVKGATAEEHGKLCADRKRATDRALRGEAPPTPPREFPEDGEIDLTDLDGCPYYARVLGADVDGLVERFRAKPPLPQEYEAYCRGENLCAYELTKRLLPQARVVTAPYAFFFHPIIRRSLFGWMGCEASKVDVVVDEAHTLPDYLRDVSTVTLPEESVRRARAEVEERGDFQLPDGPSATRFFDVVRAAIEELNHALVREDDAVLPPGVFEEALLLALGGTNHRLDTWLGALATWGENLKDERRRERRLPRSWVHTVALTLLSWPRLEPPGYAKVVTRLPRPALEAYALDAAEAARPLTECHSSVHLSGSLAPLETYRRALGLREDTRKLEVPSPFPREHCRFLYDPELAVQADELRRDPHAVARLADRVAKVLECLPVKTAVFFPDFDLMRRVLDAGLLSQLPPNPFLEFARLPASDLWRSIEGWKNDPHSSILVGVAGGRLAEGIDYPEEELEAVVLVGLPYPRATARQRALETYFDRSGGRGREHAVHAPTERAVRQAVGRLVRSEHDRGLVIVLDRRAPAFASAMPGLEPIGDLAQITRAFYGRRARWSPRASEAPGRRAEPAVPRVEPPPDRPPSADDTL